MVSMRRIMEELHYLLGRPEEVGYECTNKCADFRQIELNEFLSTIDN